MKRNSQKRFYNNTVLGIVLLVGVNALFMSTTILVSRFIKIYPQYFIIGLAIFTTVVLLVNVCFIIGYISNKQLVRKLMIGLSVFFILFGGVATYYLYRTNSLIDQMIDLDGKENVEYVLLSVDGNGTLEDANQSTIAYISGTDTFESFLKESLEEYNLKSTLTAYNGLSDVIKEIAEDNVKYVVLPKNYRKLMESLDAEANPFTHAEAIATFKTHVDEDVTDIDVSSDSFTILLTGNNEGLSDSIILASYNPQTQRVTMTSIPRDSYVPIACQGGRRDKVNHSRAISRQCFQDSIENYIGVNVDFYFEADFYAVVKVVDALGGLDITSPIDFWGTLYSEDGTTSEPIHVPKGTNHLDGKQVLTFARERYRLPGGDYDRQMNQQYVIKEIVSKLIATRNPNRLIEVLEGAKNNISTNLSLDAITALMGHAIEVVSSSPLQPMEAFRIESTQILGDGDFTQSGMWIMRPYANYVKNAKTLIETNLKTTSERRDIKQFTFSYRKPYIYVTDSNFFVDGNGGIWVGSNPSDDAPYIEEPPTQIEPDDNQVETPTPSKIVVPDFSTITNSEASVWGTKNNINVTFGVYETSQAGLVDGQFWYQTVNAGTEVNSGTTIHIVRVKIVTPQDAGDGDTETGETEGSE